MKKIKTLLQLSFLFFAVNASAQDPHFSQFYSAPMSLNPALTGITNSEVRLVGNYRSQWGTIATPFQTMSASADFSVLKKILGNDFGGVGIMLLNDQAGQSELRNTQLHLSFSYSKALTSDGNNFLSLGGQFGVAQQRINLSNLVFDNQIHGEFINPGLGSGENLSTTNKLYADVSAGISWVYTPDHYTSYYAGAAMFHINEPQVSFLDDETELLFSKITAYAGAEFRINHMMSLIPRGVFLLQGKAMEINAGALVKFYLADGKVPSERIALYLGTMHRWKDAQVMIARVDISALSFSFSYDWNISDLAKVTNGNGAMEFSVTYRSLRTKSGRSSAVHCPTF